MSQEMGTSRAREDSPNGNEADRMTDESIDELLGTLSDTHRRRLLELLLESDVQRDTDIPEAVHAGETDLSALQVSIYHIHLPHLEEQGFIDWNRDDNLVIRGPRFDEIAPFLRQINRYVNNG